ncbi:sigma-E factor negative regulatory protein [Carnimonas bestiolae]|uniref:sigma-E factor negative regulatory protein n=1 Tax=Carnimonas bestiolae TaxID=3402172 RepID=UPI003EDC87E9
MNDKVRESLSAVMDGEGDELELRRVLKSLSKSPEEADTWRRYHVIGSALRRERDIDVTTDLSAAVHERIEALHLDQLDGEGSAQAVHGKRHVGPFSFMGNAAVAAAVSLMVITGVQVYRGMDSGSATSAPGSSMASAPGVGGSLDGGAAGGSFSTVGLVSESANEQRYPKAANGDNSLFPVYADDQSSAEARRQTRLLRGFLDQHAQDGNAVSGSAARF